LLGNSKSEEPDDSSKAETPDDSSKADKPDDSSKPDDAKVVATVDESKVGPEAQDEQTKRFETFLRALDRLFIVVEDKKEGTIVGFVSYGPSLSRKGFGEIMQLYVHPDWQLKGFGSKLLKDAWRDMGTKPWSSEGLHVWCTKGNAGNKVYDKAGWEVSGYEKKIVPTMSSGPVVVAEYAALCSAPDSDDDEMLVFKDVGTTRMMFESVGAAVAVALLVILAAYGPMLWQAVQGQRPLPGFAAVPEANVGVRVQINPIKMGFPHAQCLDGSFPTYYHRAATGPAASSGKNWLLYFQGGGWCRPDPPDSDDKEPLPFPPSLIDWCSDRATSELGSTRSDAATHDFSEKPLFSKDPFQNPMFHDWHVVFIRYCDGSSFSSRPGAAILQAILKHLTKHRGFSKAAEVVVSGCSAGAVAAALHVEAVRNAVPDANIAALLDSGFFPDWSRPHHHDGTTERAPPGIWPIDTHLQLAIRDHGSVLAGSMPADCLLHHQDAPWRCAFLEHLLPFVAVPSFVLQSRFDASNVREAEDGASLRKLGEATSWRLDAALAARPGVHGLFLDSCFHHCMSWGQIAAGALGEDGPTQPEAFAAWWWDHVISPRKGAIPPGRWDHLQFPTDDPGLCSADGSTDGPPCDANSLGSPCLSQSCCARAVPDMDFWRKTFSAERLFQK